METKDKTRNQKRYGGDKTVIGRAWGGNNYGKGSNKGHISENGNDPATAGSDDEKEAPF